MSRGEDAMAEALRRRFPPSSPLYAVMDHAAVGRTILGDLEPLVLVDSVELEALRRAVRAAQAREEAEERWADALARNAARHVTANDLPGGLYASHDRIMCVPECLDADDLGDLEVERLGTDRGLAVLEVRRALAWPPGGRSAALMARGAPGPSSEATRDRG